jgi:hypothetical protein
MDAFTDRERFDAMLAATGVPLEELTPRMGLELMVQFYAENPVDGDMGASWGVITRYEEEELGFTFERSYNSPHLESDDALAHLVLYFKVGPRALAGDAAFLVRYGRDTESLADVRTFVEASPAFQVWGDRRAAGVALVCETLETWAEGRFDQWGVRSPRFPVVTMTEQEWQQTDDVSRMIRWLLQNWPGGEAKLDGLLRDYYLACCRLIWPLLPMEPSRSGIETAERFIAGEATAEELARADYLAEEPYIFFLEPSLDPGLIERETEKVARIPPAELSAMIHTPRPDDDLSPLSLLGIAAGLAWHAMAYPGIRPKESMERYRLFLSTSLLREMVGNPFSPGRRPRPEGSTGIGSWSA